MSTLYVASDQARSGKTAVSVTLAHQLSASGRKKVALFKPFHLQTQPGQTDPDGQILRQATSVQRAEAGLWPIAISQHGDSRELPVEQALEAFPTATAGADVSIVEGLSGLADPLGPVSRRLAEALDAVAIVVIGCSPGLALDRALMAKHLFGDRLAGVLLNGVTRYRLQEVKAILAPRIETEGVKVLAVVPEDRRLLGVTVSQLAEHLHGRFLNRQEKGNNLVEHFLIGGMTLDWGVLHFQRFSNKAVVVRGDRPDIQMAALATPTSCVVLTGGHPPIQYISYQTEEAAVPLIQVETDTLSTAATLESLPDKALFDHPLKQQLFGELLSQHGQWETLYRSLGL
ncbi:MAG: phosphotransacetylase family protein [Chloroflexi bacterium]|nr:phosphotransacetylase family protein [Chloroflexota bacterium]